MQVLAGKRAKPTLSGAAVSHVLAHGEASHRWAGDAREGRTQRRDSMALQDVLIDELRDMYSAENQLVKALPKLAKGAKDAGLKQLFKDHLEETKAQVLRLREVFEHLGKKPTGQHCNGMEGVIEEGADALEKDEEGASFDAGLVGAALRTEHYEVAGYHACISMAKTLGMSEVVELLKENLAEEVEAAKKITVAAKPILREASAQPEEEKKKPKSGKEKYSEKKSKEDEKKASPDVKGTKPKKPSAGSAVGEPAIEDGVED
jgi:ferritin-like metal-binding protein YciE